MYSLYNLQSNEKAKQWMKQCILITLIAYIISTLKIAKTTDIKAIIEYLW